MSEPNWPDNLKPGTKLIWDQLYKVYCLVWEDKSTGEYEAAPLTLVSTFFIHDWQIPDEPDPLKRKWMKP